MRSLRSFPIVVLGLAVACGDDAPADPETTSSAEASEPTAGSTGAVPTGDVPTGGGTTESAACVDGEVMCAEGAARVCADGVFGSAEACPGACLDGVGCVTCEPGTSVCDGDDVALCGEDGEPGAAVATCDPVQGLVCDAGACAGACAFDQAREAEVGCEFYAAPLPSLVVADGGFGVGLTNTCDGPTKLRIDVAGQPLLMMELAGNETRFVLLPRLPPLFAADVSVTTNNGAYRLRTDCPVRAVQTTGGPELASVDASRLYPTDRWGTDMRVATRATAMIDADSPPVVGYLVVTARDDGTTVTIDVPDGVMVAPVGTIPATGDGDITLDQGETLLLAAALPHDLSGARVTADRPIGVFGGHECSNVPVDVGFCDHLEEMMPPVAALGSTTVVVPPVARDLGGGRAPHIVQVVGTVDGTQVTTSDAMLSGMVDAGGVIAFGPLTEPLEIASDQPVLVAQFMVGTEVDAAASDPSMLAPPPVDQFREEHAFWTAEDWPVTVVDMVAPMGAAATLDGADVTGWTPVMGTAWVTASVVIATPGGHTLTADMPVGISVYGLKDAGSVTSYAYAGAWRWPTP